MGPEHQAEDAGHGLVSPKSVSDQTLGSQQPVNNMDLIWSPTVLEHLSDDEFQLYLEFSRSGCIRGGGCSIEVALEVLYKSGGNIMLAIEKLLSLNKDPLDAAKIDQQKLLALSKEPLDTANTNQQKLLSLNKDPTNVPTKTDQQEPLRPLVPLADQFPCKVCGRVFLKIKSRSAHMKRHKNER